MKWSEIFRKALGREIDANESKSDASPSEIEKAQLEPINAPPYGQLSSKQKAIEAKEDEVETPPFQPPRAILPDGYVYPDATESAHLHAELLRELPDGHPLFGVPLETFAASEDNQDVLFRFRGNPSRYVLVHLTGSGASGENAKNSSVLFMGMFEEWLQRENAL